MNLLTYGALLGATPLLLVFHLNH